MLRSVVLRAGSFKFFCRRVNLLPHTEKDSDGEDAYVSTASVQSVLDGVSWWREHAKVNAGLYSAELARSMYECVEDDHGGEVPSSSYRLLECGYNKCKDLKVEGTCTALVATLQPRQPDVQDADGYKLVSLESSSGDASRRAGVDNAFLDVAAVGDCTLLLLRRGRVVYVTEEQQHGLDFPFQLGTGSADVPKSSVKLLLPVQRGDVVIMGSDGVFDNVYPDHVGRIVWSELQKVFEKHRYLDVVDGGIARHPERSLSHNTRLVEDMIAALDESLRQVIDEATTVSRDAHCDSPYASKCIQEGALHEGGKPDDMSILASIVDEESPDNPEYFLGDRTQYPDPYRDWP